MTSIEGVVFDCGGTLLELDPPPPAVFLEVATGIVGREPDAEAVRAAYRTVDYSCRQSALAVRHAGKASFFDDYNRHLCLILGLASHYERLNPALQAAFHERRGWRVFEDAEPALDALAARGLRLLCVANWDANLAEVLSRAGLGRRFEATYASADLGVEKPDGRVFDRLLEERGLAPGALAYVGDDYAIDVVAARGAGLVPVVIDRFGRYPDADCLVVGSLTELPTVLSA